MLRGTGCHDGRVRLLVALAGACSLVLVGPPAIAQQYGTLSLGTPQTKFARLAPDALFATVEFQVDDATEVAVKIATLLDGVATSIVGPGGEVLNEQTIGSYGGEYCTFAGADEPQGYLISSASERGFHHLYFLPSLGPGVYAVHVEAGTPPTEDTAVLTELVTDSPTAVGLLATESLVTTGALGVLVAAVFEGSAPAVGATVSAWLKPPAAEAVTFALLDNGEQADVVAGDGLYSGIFETPEVGEYTAVAEITGLTSAGTPFTRQATTTVKVVPVHAVFAGSFSDEGVDTNGNGLFERLAIHAPVTVTTAGSYVVMIVLKTPAGIEFSAYGSMTLGAGSRVATAYVESQTLLDTGENGPYVFSAAELLFIGGDGAEPAARLRGGTQATEEYLLSQFENTAVRLQLTGNNSDEGIDADGDTDFDMLRVRVGVLAADTGTYAWGARLVDSCVGHLQFLSGQQTLTAGTPEQLMMNFSGSVIGRRGIDGPYELVDFGLTGPSGSLTMDLVLLTQAYPAGAFDAYQPFADCNGNGTPDICEINGGTAADCDHNLVPDACQHPPGRFVPEFCWGPAGVTGPTARYGHALAYDAQREVTVLFGGQGEHALLSDTWEWNGSSWTQRLTDAPPARRHHTLAYDAVNHVTVLFGGGTFDIPLRDTWTWDGSQWSAAASDGPAARFGHVMAFDEARHVVVLFGGTADEVDYFDDTWEWNGTAWQAWTGAGPSARAHAGMAWDPTRNVLVLFGGWNGERLGDTWEWDGTTWTRRATTGPSPRYGHAICRRMDSGRMLLFGGAEPSGEVADTWNWDGNTWTDLGIAGPAARVYHAMQYDAQRRCAVLSGGWGPPPTRTFYDDTYRTTTPLHIVQAPQHATVFEGEPAQFGVQAEGCSVVTYQWWKNDCLICDDEHVSGTTTNTMIFSAARYADAGEYRVTAYADGSHITTDPVLLTVRGGGDMNCDGATNFDDINPFVLAVSDPAGYAAEYPDCNILNGDIDGDADVDFDDINLFVQLLGGAEDA